ncbi:MAG: sodium:solute symporter [Planctomycetota bacterium]
MIDSLILIVYVGLMLGLGFLLTNRIREYKDYFLAGGALTTPILVCTLVSTYYELDVTFATSETAFHEGLVAWFWLSRPYYIAIFAAAFILVRRLKSRNFMTLPEILGSHYGSGARAMGALACFLYSLPIVAIAGMMLLFETLGWPLGLSLTVTIGICTIYTLLGGLWADAVSDTLQFILMCASLAFAIPLVVEKAGGWDFTNHLPSSHMTPTGNVNPWLLAAWASTALTVFVEPAFYQRIFAAKDVKSVRNSLLIGIFLWASYDWGVTIIGLAARSLVAQGLLDSTLEGKTALLTVCLQTLPVGLKGLFLGGILAAAMSSIDSYALLASGNLVYDIWKPLVNPKLSDRQLIRWTRVGVFLVFLIALGLTMAFDRIRDAWVFMASILTSVVLVPVMGALFMKPTRASGLLASGAGFIALGLFYTLIYSQGQYDEDAESWVWRLSSGFEIWREYAVLSALPISATFFFLGQKFKGRMP